MRYRTKYCEGCGMRNKLLSCHPRNHLCKERRDIPPVENSFMRLLRMALGKEVDKYYFTTMGDSRYGTKKLTPEEIEASKNHYDWMIEKKMIPIKGYIYDTPKGSFFIHDSGNPWEIVDNSPPRKNVSTDPRFTLTPGYMGNDVNNSSEQDT